MLKSQEGVGNFACRRQGHGVRQHAQRRQAARWRPISPVGLHALGFALVATRGTAEALAKAGNAGARRVNKVKDGSPHIVDMLKGGEIQLVFTTVDETRTAIAAIRN